jgi:ABC-type transport system substrate-binding protein
LAGPPAHAARPHYGGTLSVQIDGTIRSLDPNDPGAGTAARVLPLMFETLVVADGDGGLRPSLATSWERDAGSNRWRFHVRQGVKLHDGSTLEPAQVAAVLATQERGWNVLSDGDAVVVEPQPPQSDLPWTLSEPRYAVAIRTASGAAVGTGPFQLESLSPSRIRLRAHDGYWGARAFVDAVQIEQGTALRDQLTNLEGGRTDIVSVRPTDVRRLTDRGLRTATSRPLVLFALVFEPYRAQSADDVVRAALTASIDRATLSAVLLQHQAEPAMAFLPAWLSGYAPLLKKEAPRRAPPRAAVSALPADRRSLSLRVESADPIARTIAERIVVDAREGGLTVTVQVPAAGALAPRPDVRLVRVPVTATTPERALARVAQALGPRAIGLVTHDPLPPPGAPLETVLHMERTLLAYDVLLPIVHVADVYGLGDRVESWGEPLVLPTGAWNFAGAWLRGDRAGAP